MPQAVFHSPFGLFSVVEENGLITRLDWSSRRSDPTALLREACRQLDEYFAGERKAFDLPLDFGTGFLEQMRRAMLINFGDVSIFVTRPLSAAFLIAAAALMVLIALPNLRAKRDLSSERSVASSFLN